MVNIVYNIMNMKKKGTSNKKKNNIFLTKNFIFSFLFHDITSTTNSNIIKNSCRLMLIDDFVFQVLQEFDLIYYEDPE